LIKEESTSALLRFTIRHILNQVHNQLEYLLLVQEQQEQKKAQNNQQQQQQQQLHSQVILPSTTAFHQHQDPNISHRNNLVGQKMTPWKSSLLLSMQRNHHNTLW
jgi:hypothetical protein